MSSLRYLELEFIGGGKGSTRAILCELPKNGAWFVLGSLVGESLWKSMSSSQEGGL